MMEEAKAAAPLVGWYQNMEGGGGRFWWGNIFLKTLITDSGLIGVRHQGNCSVTTKFKVKDTLMLQKYVHTGTLKRTTAQTGRLPFSARRGVRDENGEDESATMCWR